MRFIQCSDESEVEKELTKLGQGFVTEDNRIYTKMSLGDEWCYYEMDAHVVNQLYQLQTHLEMVSDPGFEMGFGEIVRAAKELEDQFKKTIKAIKFKPIKKVKR